MITTSSRCACPNNRMGELKFVPNLLARAPLVAVTHSMNGAARLCVFQTGADDLIADTCRTETFHESAEPRPPQPRF
jgi:hypothetical protein